MTTMEIEGAGFAKKIDDYQYFSVWDRDGNFVLGFHVNPLLGKIYFTASAEIIERADGGLEVRQR